MQSRLYRFQYRKRYGLHAILPMTLKTTSRTLFQYRKRYGLHAMGHSIRATSIRHCFNTASGMDCMQLHRDSRQNPRRHYCFNTASGMDCMQFAPASVHLRVCPSFNTASGMDCMQYRPSQPLGQLNPEAGFLNGSLFLANRRNLAGFFCRQNRLKTSANPVISRKLLSTGKI